MRFMLTFRISAEKGNALAREGNLRPNRPVYS
jgi:hypothetical protein